MCATNMSKHPESQNQWDLKNQHFGQNQNTLWELFYTMQSDVFIKPLQLTVHSIAYLSPVLSPSRPVFLINNKLMI